jgi:hypothetical protein
MLWSLRLMTKKQYCPPTLVKTAATLQAVTALAATTGTNPN